MHVSKIKIKIGSYHFPKINKVVDNVQFIYNFDEAGKKKLNKLGSRRGKIKAEEKKRRWWWWRRDGESTENALTIRERSPSLPIKPNGVKHFGIDRDGDDRRDESSLNLHVPRCPPSLHPLLLRRLIPCRRHPHRRQSRLPRDLH